MKKSSEFLPTYDQATGSAGPSKPGNGDASQYPTDVKVRSSDAPVPAALAMPEPHNGTAVASVAPTVYYYVNPKTGDRVASLLPPDHPEMICLQEGKHKNETRFGIVGIIFAVIWFPLGIGLCLLDRRTRCKRCGKVTDHGICG